MATTQISSNLPVRMNENASLVGKGKNAIAGKTSNRLALGTLANTNTNVDGARIKQAATKKTTLQEHSKHKLKNSNATTNLLKPKPEPVKPTTSDIPSIDVFDLAVPERPSSVKDIDAEDSENPQLVAEYINEIYVYLRKIERLQCVEKDYMTGYQITPRMRTILIDWLVQVHQRFHLLQETLYLTVAIIDRFLQHEEVSKSKLQLVGVTAMWIASKYEEMYAPEVADFVYITDNAYTKANIRQMECIILRRLNFDLGRPLPLHFLRRYSKAGEVDSMKHTLAKYLLEMSLLDYQLVHRHPSEVSAAALCLSLRLLDDEVDKPWDDALEYYSQYSEEHLKPIMERLALAVHKSEASKQQAVRQKYMSSKFMRISRIEELNSVVIEELAKCASP